jgi:hypothetical protein
MACSIPLSRSWVSANPAIVIDRQHKKHEPRLTIAAIANFEWIIGQCHAEQGGEDEHDEGLDQGAY